MKIRYIGKARVRVGDICSFDPGEERDIEDSIGKELCRGDEFEDLASAGSTSEEEENPEETHPLDPPLLKIEEENIKRKRGKGK